jgi:TonB family protein
MKLITLALCLVLFASGMNRTIRGQGNAVPASAAVATESSERTRDGLNGSVRRLRVESAKILIKDGKAVESPRELRELVTYDPKGRKIDSVAYPVEGTTLPGREKYRYDKKGNIIEMVLSAEDGSILSKERYEYEFDEFGNWKKMTSAVAVYENGKLSYEPVEITYRTITYYYSQAVASVAAAPVDTPVSNTPVANRPAAATDRGLTRNAVSRTETPKIGTLEQPKSATTVEKTASKSEETTSGNIVNTPLSNTPVSNLPAPATDQSLTKNAISTTEAPMIGTVEQPKSAPPDNKTASSSEETTSGSIVKTPVSGTPVSNLSAAATDQSLTKNGISTTEVPKIVTVEQPKSVTPDEKTESESNSEETTPGNIVKTETPTEASEPVPPKVEVSKLPVVHLSEAELRKAAVELPQPEYPAQAILAGVGGKVEVQFIIDEKGAVTTVRPISGNSMLTEAAASAARRARFSATALSSQPANVFGVITYDFPLTRPETTSTSVTTLAEPPKPTLDEKAARAEKAAATITNTKAAKPVEASGNTPTKDSALDKGSNTRSTVAPKTPTSPYATAFEKGMASLATGKYADAAGFFRQVVQVDPNDALAYSKLGIAYSALKQHKEAIGAFKQAIRLKRAFVDFDSYYRMGDAYIALGEHKAAIDSLRQAIYGLRAQVLDPQPRKPVPGSATELDIHYALGLAYYGSGTFRDAAKEFEEVVRLKPDFASAHYGLGLSYYELGDTRSAKKEENILLKMKSPLANKLTGLLLVPAARKNRVF